MFVVAVARLGFDTSQALTLKEKRSFRRKIIQRVRNKFPVAIAEIESNDHHSHLILGLAVVSNDIRHAESMIDKIIGFIEHIYIVPLEYREREIINLGVLKDPFWEIDDIKNLDWESLKKEIEENSEL